MYIFLLLQFPFFLLSGGLLCGDGRHLAGGFRLLRAKPGLVTFPAPTDVLIGVENCGVAQRPCVSESSARPRRAGRGGATSALGRPTSATFLRVDAADLRSDWLHGPIARRVSRSQIDHAVRAERDVLPAVVAVAWKAIGQHYRLGRLGFFDHPALAAEREDGAPAANYGLMDIIRALRWVQESAAA